MAIIKTLTSIVDLAKAAVQAADMAAGAQQTQWYSGYQKSDAVKQAEELLKQHLANRPSAYNSQYQSKMDAVASQIENREPFKYDVNGDALYQQYKDRYIHNGQRAMQDTMGQAAALTGGYGSSYAQNVGQQAYNEYMMGLNDVIPELQQLALDKYDRETARLQNQYALYSDLEDRDYNAWKDKQTEYYTELERLTEDSRYQSEMDYSKYASEYEAYQKAVEAANKTEEDAEEEEAYKLQKYKFAGKDSETDEYKYYLGDKQFTYSKGINPHTGTVNPDAKNGTFGESYYQPDNIGGKKLTWTGQYATMNGHKQKVWMKPDGTLWMWDDTSNSYVKHNVFVEVDTDATRSFMGGIMPEREFASRNQGKYASYKDYLEATIDKWLTDGKLNDTEAATLMVRYGLI